MSKKKTAARSRRRSPPPQTVLDAAIGWKVAGGGKGRGVFARRALRKGEVVEIAPVIPVAKDAVPDDGGAPDGYLLEWDGDERGSEYCMPLGYVMLYNHSDKPNIAIESDYRKMEMTVRTLRAVARGEELAWDYNCDIWFDED